MWSALMAVAFLRSTRAGLGFTSEASKRSTSCSRLKMSSSARVDLKKATAINADHIRLLPEAELAERLIPYLQAGGVLGDQVTEEQRALVAAATPLVQTRM